jgi:tetratricopeptide (TPR) repeat protein
MSVACPFLPALATDDPAVAVKRSFNAAKSALAAGDLPEAEGHYGQTIALCLRQIANLSVSESRFVDATRNLDEALKFAPGDPEIATDAAVAWFRAGEVQRARELVASALAANPHLARARNVLGRIDLFRGDFESAIQELRAAVDISEDFETSYFLGVAYLRAKRFHDAQQWFEHLRVRMGDSAALHVLIGRAYSIAHYPEPAVAEFRTAVQLDAKYPRAHGLLGYSILEFRGEEAYPQARVEFEKELKLRPDDYHALLLLGIADVALRDFSAAEAALLHAKRLRPDEAFPYLYLGEIFTETNRWGPAVEALEKFLHLLHDPEEVPRDTARAFFLLGQGLRRLGRIEEAQKALLSSQRYREAKFRYDAQHIFDEPGKLSDGDSHTSDRLAGLVESGAIEDRKTADGMILGGVAVDSPAQPTTPVQRPPETTAAKQYREFVSEILASSYNDLGVIRAKAAKFNDAAEYFRQAAAWKPDLAGLDRNWGLACYRAEQYSEAIPPLERQLTASPQDAFLRQLLGLSYFMTDNFVKTAEVLRPFLKNPPDDPGLLFAWGTSLVRIRQTEPAMGIFRRLLEQNAANPAVHLLLGQAYAQQNDFVNSLAELQRAVELDPRLPEAHYYAGLVFLRQSDFDSAAKEFRAELEVRPGEPVTTYHLGFALLSKGEVDAAAASFREAIKARPEYEVAYFELGRALLAGGDVGGAIESLETAKRLAPDRDSTYYQLSQAYRRAGRKEDASVALATYRRLIEESRLKKRESLESEKP